NQCRCNVCLSSPFSTNVIEDLNLLSTKNFDIIREEDEDEEESSSLLFEQQKVDSNDKIMFISQQKEPIRPLRFRANKSSDRIEPFQKPDDLKSFWQQPKETSINSSNDKKTVDHNDDDDDLSKVLLRRDSNQPLSSSSSSSSNFIRSNNHRNSCPPTSRRQRNKSVVTTIIDDMKITPSPNINQKSSFSLYNNEDMNDRNSFVDTIQTKFNNVVRKSWLSSFFHPFNSKEKQSKWKKSNDFKAEFFDHQNNLMTESLLNRKSPLLYLDLNRRNENERKNQPQMSSLSPNNNENLT
ncbi:hypothetical protein BLA29_007825, partial [Euroglyphus maynei]